MIERLEAMAPLFQIEYRILEPGGLVRLSGPGFSGPEEEVVLSRQEAEVRLLAEICSILSRWIPFSMWEACDQTLFALPPERVARCAASFRKQLAQRAKEAKRSIAEELVRAVLSELDLVEERPGSHAQTTTRSDKEAGS